ncbi:MAG: flagellar biosynthesis protein FlhB [Thermodesulfobacteriota bacterium]|nr:flagellar biosynthesis protein FlhB [Thermodesulfobacteriota bacterium]
MPKESEDGQERTEQPTSKRIRDAREKGQVAKSIEVSTAFLFFASILAFYFYIPLLASKMIKFTRLYLGNTLIWDGTKDSLVELFYNVVIDMSAMLLPIFIVFLFIGFFSNFIQVGFQMTVEPIIPKLSKLDPIKGIKQKFFSMKSLEMLVKCILVLIIITWVAWRAIKREIPVFPPLINCDIGVIVLTYFKAAMHLLWDALWVFIIIAIADYAFQKWQHRQDLMMTKQEVREELKQTEGNPQIKSRIRSIQLHIARRRMMQEVPKADVVITNPTHLAIALQYERGKMIAPTVVAKGAGVLAEKIKEIARSSWVPIVEDKPLASLLYKSVEVGEAISEDMYKAVAEILAYVYRIKKEI